MERGDRRDVLLGGQVGRPAGLVRAVALVRGARSEPAGPAGLVAIVGVVVAGASGGQAQARALLVLVPGLVVPGIVVPRVGVPVVVVPRRAGGQARAHRAGARAACLAGLGLLHLGARPIDEHLLEAELTLHFIARAGRRPEHAELGIEEPLERERRHVAVRLYRAEQRPQREVLGLHRRLDGVELEHRVLRLQEVRVQSLRPGMRGVLVLVVGLERDVEPSHLVGRVVVGAFGAGGQAEAGQGKGGR